jgi:hypothetical protein
MKKLFITLFAIGMLSTSFAQWGLGIGTSGLNLKTNPDKTFGLIFRQNASISGDVWRFSSELNGVVRLVNKSDIKFHLGLGGGIDYGKVENKFSGNYFVKFPVGLEYFMSDRWSISVESGFSYFLSQKFFSRGLGLFEITYYFDR